MFVWVGVSPCGLRICQGLCDPCSEYLALYAGVLIRVAPVVLSLCGVVRILVDLAICNRTRDRIFVCFRVCDRDRPCSMRWCLLVSVQRGIGASCATDLVEDSG
jgi:hypothetical protein